MKKLAHAAGMAALLAFVAGSVPALAADDDLSAIRREIGAMRHDYETKIRNLEARLKHAEADARSAKAAAARATERTQVAATPAPQPAPAVVAEAVPPPPPPEPIQDAAPPPNASAGATAFNPTMGVVLNGNFAASSRDTDGQRILGFQLGDEAGLAPRGFSLGESEISLSANVDPYLSAALIASLTPDGEAEVEEAYVQTGVLGGGFTIKAGRFLSAIGYLNEHHAHQWYFADSGLAYRAFLGSQYGDDGVQVKWLAPTDIFLEFGAEWFRGDSFPAANAGSAGKGTMTAFVHAGDDIDESSSWLAGLSYMHARANRRETGDSIFGTDVFGGTDDIGIASLIYKWAPGGNPVQQNLTLAAEYFYGREKGNFDGVPVNLDRSGWYAQGVYQFMPRWSVGLRYAQASSGDVPLALAGTALDDLGHTPRAETALLEYDTSEFGRFRLQYTHDESDIHPNDEVLFTYTITYGAHGAHRY